MRCGAQERTRTFTAVKPLAPEASASTNSATWAQVAGCERRLLRTGCPVVKSLMCRKNISLEHDLIGKPVPTFPDHALMLYSLGSLAYREMAKNPRARTHLTDSGSAPCPRISTPWS